jgi:hypothetical protein
LAHIERLTARVNKLEEATRKRKRTENLEDADDESKEALPLRKRTRVPKRLQDRVFSHSRYLLGLLALDLNELEFPDSIKGQKTLILSYF